MGQNALLFNEQYQPKKAYDSFKQGIIDGKATVKIDRDGVRSDGHPITLNPVDRNGFLSMPPNAGKIKLYTISGRYIGTSSVNKKGVSTDKLSHGVYLLKTVSHEGSIGMQEVADYICIKQ